MTPRTSTSSGTGIDLLTLVITAAASAAAAFACSKIWAPGTLASAAFTPVLVAVLKEALARPAKVVTQAVPVRGVVRSALGPSGTEVRAAAHAPQSDAAPAPAATTATEPQPAPEQPPLERVAQQGEISYHHSGPSPSTARRWRLAIITGLLGFVIAVLVFTVPELIAGTKHTTFFGNPSSKSAPPVVTTTVPARTVTQPPPVTVTQPPPVTVTAPPVVTTTAPSPALTTTTPAATTPLPAPSGPGSATAQPSGPVPVGP